MRHFLSSLFCLTTLAGCGSGTVRDTLGLDRPSPDEFRVVSRPPLSVPPQFDLRPPSLETSSPTGIRSDAKAQSLIRGGAAGTAVVPVESKSLEKTSSKGESQFLKNIGAYSADPSVRDQLQQQQAVKEQKEEEAGWWDVLSTGTERKEPVVKAEGEAERLKKNKQAGKPVTEGETPETGTRDTGVLGRILGY
jgi:hypothetical protein